DVRSDGPGELFVGLISRQLKQLLELVRAGFEASPGVNLLAGVGEPAHDALRRLRIIPEARSGGLFFETGYFLLVSRDVKDGGGRARCALEVRLVSVRSPASSASAKDIIAEPAPAACSSWGVSYKLLGLSLMQMRYATPVQVYGSATLLHGYYP